MLIKFPAEEFFRTNDIKIKNLLKKIERESDHKDIVLLEEELLKLSSAIILTDYMDTIVSKVDKKWNMKNIIISRDNHTRLKENDLRIVRAIKFNTGAASALNFFSSQIKKRDTLSNNQILVKEDLISTNIAGAKTPFLGWFASDRR